MNNSTYRFTLDLRKHQSQMSIAVFRNDTAVRLIISLTDGGKPYRIEDGCTAFLYGKRADEEPLIHRCMIKENTEIIYDFEPTISCVEGIVKCDIRLYGKDGKLITAPRFIVVVDERLVSDDDIDIDGASPTSALDRILAMTTEVEETVVKVNEKLAEIKDGDNAHFRYSAYADGTDFTETWSPGQDYIGIASQAEAPTTKEGYTWSLFKGEQGNGVKSVNSGEAVVDEEYTTTPVTVTTTDGQTGTLLIKAKNGTAGLFVGTWDEYNAADKAGEIAVGMIVVITDEGDYITSAILGEAILGQMILG